MDIAQQVTTQRYVVPDTQVLSARYNKIEIGYLELDSLTQDRHVSLDTIATLPAQRFGSSQVSYTHLG